MSGLCVCRRCGPPWRYLIPEPPAGRPGSLSWHSWMALCPRCGDKRCAGATDHDHPCEEE